MAIIGGSFNESIISIFQKNNIFRKLYFFSYMNTQKIFTASKKSPDITNIDPLPVEALNTILSADVVILEENSSSTISSHGQKLYSALGLG